MNEPKGKAIGALARAQALSPERRKEIAKKAADAKKEIASLPIATHGSADHPLKIGEIEIPAYVLEDGTRVLSQRGVIEGLGMKSGSAGGGDDRLGSFLGGKGISPFVPSDLSSLISSPIKFKPPTGGVAFGYPATVLADLCDVVLSARKEGVLQKQQEHIAHQCEILVRGFARVGIVALVDEATGYQKDRAKDALATILEAFIAKELQPWLKTFPSDFYEEMFRLRGLPFPTGTVRKPQYFGLLTNNIVYDRLAPGIREELQRGVPRNEEGRPTAKYFQKLTQNTGYPKLRELLGSVVTIMKFSTDWKDFVSKLDKMHPRYGANYELDLEDTGKGL